MNKKQLEAKREEIKQKVYDIVLAARTEGIICGKTKQFADGDAEDILSQLSSLGVMLVDKEVELPANPHFDREDTSDYALGLMNGFDQASLKYKEADYKYPTYPLVEDKQ